MLFRLIKSFYNNSTLRGKFFIVLVLVSVLPMTIIQLMNYIAAADIWRKQVENLMELNLRQTHSNVDSTLKSYRSLLADICNEEIVIENVAKINVWDIQFELSKRILREEVKKMTFGKDGILGVALVSRNGEYAYYDRMTLSNIESFCLDFQSIRTTPMVVDALASPEKVSVHTGHASLPGYTDKNIIYFSKGLLDFRNLKQDPIGTVILCIDERVLSDAFNLSDTADMTFVVNQSRSVISASREELLGGMLPQIEENVDFEESIKNYVNQKELGRPFVVKYYSVPGSNYTVVHTQSDNDLLDRVYLKGTWIVAIGILFILIAVAIINHTSYNIDCAMKLIIGSMHEANKGNLDVRIDNSGRDEFAQISQNFNHMLSEMKNLIHKEHLALNNKREAEIKALEAQINPHFLYNTLDSINWVAIEKGQTEISKMLKYLAIILRYSISNSNGVVTLEEELEYLKKYVYLQQNRYAYAFLCLIRMDDEVSQCRIHKLLLQPLIENSIEHAFPGHTGQDKIEVTVSMDNAHRLRVDISDNGVGMDDSLIEELNGFDCEAGSIRSNIGMRNVISRVKIYYGEAGAFHIEKNADEGIHIMLSIPYED